MFAPSKKEQDAVSISGLEKIIYEQKATTHPVGFLLAALVIIVLVANLLTSDPSQVPLEPGNPAPDFKLATLTEPARSLSLVDFRGQIVLLNFWTTWCKPCQDEMPSLDALYEQLKDDDFTLLAVSIDENKEDVIKFRNAYNLSFPVLLDPTTDTKNRYQIHHYPETFLIGREGTILAHFIGPRDWADPLQISTLRQVIATDAEPKQQHSR